MRRLFRQNLILLGVSIFLIVGCMNEQHYEPSNLSRLSQEEVLDRFKNRELPNPERVIFRSQEGSEIPLDSLQKIDPRDYAQHFYQNERGEIKEVVFKLANAEERAFNEKLEKAFNEGPDVEIVEVNCDDKVQLLQRVFDRDQSMRRGDAQIDPSVDHENLEIIVSFLEKCGMPTSEEVNDVQMAGIWAVLQHAPARYQKKYIPVLEESAQKGDVKWSVIAIMKDRALMDEGKPQIYGSQISNGELYDLFEPEYVNQRREEMDMEPIEEYLQRFDIEFNIEQKRK